MAKLFEKVDDKPGSYFGMLVEGFEDKKEYSSGNYFLTVDETGMGPHYSLYYQHPNSNYDGLMFIVDGYGYDNFKEKLSKFSTVYPNKDVQNLLNNINENKSVSINDESLKEDKFVSRDKMSKKAQKELNDKKRGTWGNTNPVTRFQPNKKVYDRKRDKKELDEDFDSTVLNDKARKELKEGAISLQYITDGLFDIINNPNSTYVGIADTAYELKSMAEYLYDVYNRYSRQR